MDSLRVVMGRKNVREGRVKKNKRKNYYHTFKSQLVRERETYLMKVIVDDKKFFRL